MGNDIRVSNQALDVLTKFFSELPRAYSDLQRWKLGKQYEREIYKNKINLQHEMQAHKDAKNAELLSGNRLAIIEAEYRETGLDLEKLNDELRSDGAIQVLKNISEYDATDIKGRTALLNQQAQQHEVKYKAIADLIYGDIHDAKQILGGGAGFEGGTDPTGWDKGDLTEKAYRMYKGLKDDDPTTPDIDEREPTPSKVAEYFEANPGEVETSLAILQGTKGKLDYYEKQREEIGRVNSQQSLAQLLTTAKSNTGLPSIAQIEGFDLQDKWPDSWTKDQIAEAKTNIATNKAQISQQYAMAIGQMNLYNATPENERNKWYEDYKDIHILAKATAATYQGVISPPNFAPFYDAVREGYEYYKEADPSIQPTILAAAKTVFGFDHLSYEGFFHHVSANYSNVVLTPIFDAGLINQEDKQEDQFDLLLGGG